MQHLRNNPSKLQPKCPLLNSAVLTIMLLNTRNLHYHFQDLFCIDTVFINTEPPCRLPCDLDWSSLSMSELITGSLGFYLLDTKKSPVAQLHLHAG
jgi:hypothetical protein